MLPRSLILLAAINTTVTAYNPYIPATTYAQANVSIPETTAAPTCNSTAFGRAWTSYYADPGEGDGLGPSTPGNLTGVKTVTRSCDACCIYRYILSQQWTWSYLSPTPVTVGTEIVIIDRKNNRTSTTTEVVTTSAVVSGQAYGPDGWQRNGTFFGSTLPGPKTAEFIDLNGDNQTLTYPTPFSQIQNFQRWKGQVPFTSDGTALCISNDGAKSPLPTPTNTPTMPPGVTDSSDPNGVWWTLQPERDPAWMLNSRNVSSWYNGGVISAVQESCYSPDPVAPATSVNIASYLLDTTTSYGSVAAPATTKRPATPSPTSAVAEPVTQSTTEQAPSASTEPASQTPPPPVAIPTAQNETPPAQTPAAPETSIEQTPEGVENPQPSTTNNALRVLQSALSPPAPIEARPTTTPNIGDVIASGLDMTRQSEPAQTTTRSQVSQAPQSPQFPAVVATAGSQTIVAAPSGSGVIIVSATMSYALAPGAQTSIGDEPYSVGTSNVVVSGSTVSIPASRISPASQSVTPYTGAADRSEVRLWLASFVVVLASMMLG